MYRKFKLNRNRAIGICLIFLFIAGTLVHILIQRDSEQNIARLHSDTTISAGEVRNRLEYQVHGTLSLVMGSLVYVSSHPDITQQEFAAMAANIMQRAPFLLSLSLAKNNVITHIYPLQDNRALLGLHYMEHAEQKVAVERAIASKQAVLAGPLDLKQGGKGLINRIPIFLNNEEHSYWGMASVAIKMDEFYRQVGIEDLKQNLKFALRGKDGRGDKGEVFYGDPALFDDDRNVRLEIPLANGKWQLAAAPTQGWTVDSDRRNAQYLIGMGVCLCLAFLLYSLLLANVELNREKNHAIKSAEQKDFFFTHITHELRTPLTSIFGVVRMLEGINFKENGESAQPLLANAHRNCDRLMHLVSDILDQRKLELGQMTYLKEPTSVASIVDEAMDEMQLYAKQYYIHLLLSHPISPDIMVFADGKRLTQVLINLLANAIKFSPADSQVEINVKAQNETVCISIIDQGPGIEGEVQKSIFEEFVQADHVEPNHRIPHGSGLGLTISKKLVEDHGGSLSGLNSAEGGAAFHIMLPKYLNFNDNYKSDDIKAGKTALNSG